MGSVSPEKDGKAGGEYDEVETADERRDDV